MEKIFTSGVKIFVAAIINDSAELQHRSLMNHPSLGKRAKFSSGQSIKSVIPVRIRSLRIFPVAGECITPCPLNPLAKRNPALQETRREWDDGPESSHKVQPTRA